MRTSKKSLPAAVAALTAGVLALGVGSARASSAQTVQNDAALKPTIVLVHGAWADGSSWSAVTSKLQRAGYTVDVEANPLRGLATDAQYLRDLLATIPGPVVLVGHSYGGMVTTSAATGNPNVKALVYVDAFIPDQGDSLGALAAAEPGSELDPNSSITTVPIHDAAWKHHQRRRLHQAEPVRGPLRRWYPGQAGRRPGRHPAATDRQHAQ